MYEPRLSTEVLVPRDKAWWTFLALSAEFSNQSSDVVFVRQASESAHALYVDAALISSLPRNLRADARVIVILWDGYQSFLEYGKSIDEVERRVEKLEIRTVGDPSEWVQRCRGDSGRFKLLFPQGKQLYNVEMLRQRMGIFSFPDHIAKMEIVHRSMLISGKVAIQLFLGGRCKEYLRTKYVFCGQTGLETLRKYCASFGMAIDRFGYPEGGLRCDEDFIADWIATILRNREHWASRIVTRGLFRLIALRALYKSKRNEIFLNIYPRVNINAYQTEMFFRRHYFLEFGGINGDEAIYPRTADIAFLGRKMIRFDSTTAIQRMMKLDDLDIPGLSSFIKWCGEEVTSRLEFFNSNI
jgi:hypothetical protein